MMQKIQTIQFELPSHWACALLYDDNDGFDADDERAIERFVDHMVDAYGQCICVDVHHDENGDFRHTHDATQFGVLACDVATFTFDITQEGE